MKTYNDRSTTSSYRSYAQKLKDNDKNVKVAKAFELVAQHLEEDKEEEVEAEEDTESSETEEEEDH